MTFQVTDTENKLTKWASSVTRLRSQHEWLLFFSVPKQLLLYRLIQEWNEENAENLVYLVLKEVMFLVSNDHQTREQLSEDIQVKEDNVDIVELYVHLYFQHIQ